MPQRKNGSKWQGRSHPRLKKPEDEISYIDTANLEDMAKEERTWIAKKIVSLIGDVRAVRGDCELS